MRIKGKRVLKNGAIGAYVYNPKSKKWNWRIIGHESKHKGGGKRSCKKLTRIPKSQQIALFWQDYHQCICPSIGTPEYNDKLRLFGNMYGINLSRKLRNQDFYKVMGNSSGDLPILLKNGKPVSQDEIMKMQPRGKTMNCGPRMAHVLQNRRIYHKPVGFLQNKGENIPVVQRLNNNRKIKDQAYIPTAERIVNAQPVNNTNNAKRKARIVNAQPVKSKAPVQSMFCDAGDRMLDGLLRSNGALINEVKKISDILREKRTCTKLEPPTGKFKVINNKQLLKDFECTELYEHLVNHLNGFCQAYKVDILDLNNPLLLNYLIVTIFEYLMYNKVSPEDIAVHFTPFLLHDKKHMKLKEQQLVNYLRTPRKPPCTHINRLLALVIHNNGLFINEVNKIQDALIAKKNCFNIRSFKKIGTRQPYRNMSEMTCDQLMDYLGGHLDYLCGMFKVDIFNINHSQLINYLYYKIFIHFMRNGIQSQKLSAIFINQLIYNKRYLQFRIIQLADHLAFLYQQSLPPS